METKTFEAKQSESVNYSVKQRLAYLKWLLECTNILFKDFQNTEDEIVVITGNLLK